MCVRFYPLTMEEAEAVLSARTGGRARALTEQREFDPVHDALPGSMVPVYLPSKTGALTTVSLTWGFPLEGKPHAVFNTRLETALRQLRDDRRGMWARAIAEGRCLVPVRAFYESHATERVASEKTGKPVRRQYRFTMPGARAFLLAGIQQDGRFSIVTTEPNAIVAPIHDRMPLVLGSGESTAWLGSDFAALANRSAIILASEPER